MIFRPLMLRVVLIVLLGFGLAGCGPHGSSPMDEQKESYFLTGKSRLNSLDFEGAVQSFQKALEVNPQNGSAHFELGLLNYERVNDYAAAIYHFEKFLRLRPSDNKAETVRQFILASKQELAKTVSLAPVSQTLQRDLERVVTENKKLTEENKELRTQLDAWRNYAAQLQAAAAAPSQAQPVIQTASRAQAQPAQSEVVHPTPVAREIVAPARKTHTVASGESPYSIAKRYGISVDRLLAANPGVQPRRMQVGHELTIPGP